MPNEKNADLRVVEEVTHSEEVVRLNVGAAEMVETISRIQVAGSQEKPTVLATEVGKTERRTYEPGIDVIIEGARESEDLEDGWQEGRRQRPVPFGWFVLGFVFVLVAVGWSSGWFSGKTEEIQTLDRAKVVSMRRLEEELEIRKASEQVDRVEEHVKRYANAGSIEELLPLVRHPGRVAPMMREWYERHPFENHPFGRMLLFQPMTLETRNFFVVRYDVKAKDAIETVLVEDMGEEGFLVDWETAVCFQPVSWDHYVKARQTGAMQFRVWIEPDHGGLYSHEFQDEDEWLAIKLTALESDEFLIGYVGRGSDLEQSLQTLMEDHEYRKVAVLLELEVPENVQSLRGVVIKRLVSKSWLQE